MNNPMSNEILRRDAALCTSRRAFLAGAGAMVVWANAPRFAFAGNRDPRLIVVVLRGAVDGLAMVPPVGDTHYRSLRGDLAIGADGAGRAPAGRTFLALNQTLCRDFMPLTGRGQAAIVQAVATPLSRALPFRRTGRPRKRGWVDRARRKAAG